MIKMRTDKKKKIIGLVDELLKNDPVIVRLWAHKDGKQNLPINEWIYDKALGMKEIEKNIQKKIMETKKRFADKGHPDVKVTATFENNISKDLRQYVEMVK